MARTEVHTHAHMNCALLHRFKIGFLGTQATGGASNSIILPKEGEEVEQQSKTSAMRTMPWESF